DLAKFKGQLRGQIVLTQPARSVGLPTKALASRLTDAELDEVAQAAEPTGGASPYGLLRIITPPSNVAAVFRGKLYQFLKDEGVAAVIMPSLAGDGGLVFAPRGGSREPKDRLLPPMVALAIEHYNRLARLLDKKIPVRMELQVETKVYEQTLDSYNVIAEIPGGRKKDEVVMLGAHLDTWHGGTGATDDGTGCAVMMEAARILKALGLKMDRTIRVALWSAEEQGLLGSRAYVKEHFGDPQTMVLTGAHAKLAAYYNYDNGAGKIRGIYLQGNDMLRPVFTAWLAPFRDLGVATVTIRNTGGTDHLSFDALGLPGFQFIQDSLDYGTRTHHSNMDVYDRVPPGDLMQSAAVVASMVYHTAVREQLLPRKPLPKAVPAARPRP
ncbi:MAG: M20/M25/M40 family metallo-hydrolase, partial [Acidobacteria bacterium]|nr:M20/M25/M40 family metallo-hydrolase [Acidobacteriota bacterium]